MCLYNHSPQQACKYDLLTLATECGICIVHHPEKCRFFYLLHAFVCLENYVDINIDVCTANQVLETPCKVDVTK